VIFSTQINKFEIEDVTRPEIRRIEKTIARDVVSYYKTFGQPEITYSNESENALLMIVALKQSFQLEPVVVSSTVQSTIVIIQLIAFGVTFGRSPNSPISNSWKI